MTSETVPLIKHFEALIEEKSEQLSQLTGIDRAEARNLAIDKLLSLLPPETAKFLDAELRPPPQKKRKEKP